MFLSSSFSLSLYSLSLFLFVGFFFVINFHSLLYPLPPPPPPPLSLFLSLSTIYPVYLSSSSFSLILSRCDGYINITILHVHSFQVFHPPPPPPPSYREVRKEPHYFRFYSAWSLSYSPTSIFREKTFWWFFFPIMLPILSKITCLNYPENNFLRNVCNQISPGTYQEEDIKHR